MGPPLHCLSDFSVAITHTHHSRTKKPRHVDEHLRISRDRPAPSNPEASGKLDCIRSVRRGHGTWISCKSANVPSRVCVLRSGTVCGRPFTNDDSSHPACVCSICSGLRSPGYWSIANEGPIHFWRKWEMELPHRNQWSRAGLVHAGGRYRQRKICPPSPENL